MRVIALNGSPRVVGNTSNIVMEFLDLLNRDGIETEQVQLYGYDLTPCNDCRTCEMRGDGRCNDEYDGFNDLLGRLRAADGVLLASPGYAGAATGVMRLFLERAQLTLAVGDKALRGKVGAAISVSAHDGAESAYGELCRWMLMNEMLVVGSHPLPVFRALNSPQYGEDKGAMKGLECLARNMSWALRGLARERER